MSQRFDPLLGPLRDLPEHLLMGVSGGIDSVSLLHALISVGKKPIVLHFDHGWRAESKADAKWVEQLAKSYGLVFFKGIAPRTIAKTETAAREARDAFFLKAAKKFKCSHLLLGHHANDQVETFLLQLFRGTGSGGVGMESSATREKLTRLRPWLGIWKKEIEAYAQNYLLEWREDSTNLEVHHHRNWIRHSLLPQLEKQMKREVAPILLRTSILLRDQTAALRDQILPYLGQEQLSVSTLKSLSIAARRLLIKSWLEFHAVSDLSFDRIDSIIQLVTQTKPAKINLPRGDFVRRTEGKIWIDRGKKTSDMT